MVRVRVKVRIRVRIRVSDPRWIASSAPALSTPGQPKLSFQ